MRTLNIKKIFIALAMLAAAGAHAGAKVVGVEIGVSTVEQVRQVAAAAGKVQNMGTNELTKGVMFGVTNPDVGIEGVSAILFVFDQAGKLVGVGMRLPSMKSMQDLEKKRFDEMDAMLAEKYKRTKKVRPFVGDRFARYSAPDTVIELDAPHLSNEMNLSYRTPAFVQLENIGLKAQAQDKRTTEKSRL